MTSPHPPARIAAFVIPGWLLSHVVLIAGHVVVVAVYSLAINPGHPAEVYEAWAGWSGPWYSIVVGGPAFYVVGRLLGRWLGTSARTAGLLVWGLYTATDLAIVLAVGGVTALVAGQWAASQALKLGGVWLGTRLSPPPSR